MQRVCVCVSSLLRRVRSRSSSPAVCPCAVQVSMLQQQNQLPVVYADVRRGLAVAAVVEAATVSDTTVCECVSPRYLISHKPSYHS